MPAGKIPISDGVGLRAYVPYGISISSSLRYAKQGSEIPDCAEIERLRRRLRSAFRRYVIDCGTIAPTATERRKVLRKIKALATRLAASPNRPNAWALLDALETPDLGARKLAYQALSTRAGLFKGSLRNWRIASPADPAVKSSVRASATVDDPAVMSGVHALAGLDIEALVPRGGKFPDPALANLVAALVPVWKKVTRRTAGLVQANVEGDKRCPFANWLGETHDLLRVPRPSVARVIDIVRRVEREKIPHPKSAGEFELRPPPPHS